MEKEIPITSGTGTGRTELAAFDAALFDAGIANYNLVHLSSIVPEGCRLVRHKLDRNQMEYGFKLYVVIATAMATEVGKEGWAGLGWVVTEGVQTRGLFVEHAGSSEHEVAVAIRESLTSMVKYRPDTFGEVQQEIVGITCKGKPVCAVVAAVYQSEGWDS